MRTKPVIRLFALALVLMMTLAVPAYAAECVLCGAESGSDAYLCADCLLGMLEEKDISGGLEIADVTVNEDGAVTLAWSDSGDNGPYSVYYSLLEQSPVPFGWTAVKNVQASAVTLNQLAPGVSYVFTVEDAAGNQAKTNYYAGKVENGNEIGAKIRVHTKLIKETKPLDYPWSAAEIQEDNGYQHGLYVKMAYSMLRKTRNYAFSLTVEAPNGFADVVYSGNLTLNYGKSEVPAWGFVPMDDYFSYLERYYGGVPTGEYKVSMHFDGKHVYTVTFNVME